MLPPDELAPLYRSAAVHACPSWYETPGLASLEAALCGCRVVSTERGSAPEYFGDEAEYCSPRDPASIRAAILRARSRPPSPALAEQISGRFNWQRAAEATAAGYELALKHAASADRQRPHRHASRPTPRAPRNLEPS